MGRERVIENPYARTEMFEPEEAEDELKRSSDLLTHSELAAGQGNEYWAAIFAARSLHHALEAFEYAPDGETEHKARELMYRAARSVDVHREGLRQGG